MTTTEKPELRAPDDTVTTTVWSWLLSLAPAVGILALLPIAGSTGSGVTSGPPVSVLLTGLAYIAFVFIARADARQLRNNGVPKPFPWPWAFFAWAASAAALVYVIGRMVVLRRRTAGAANMGPFWLFVALEAVLFVTTIVIGVTVILPLVAG